MSAAPCEIRAMWVLRSYKHSTGIPIHSVQHGYTYMPHEMSLTPNPVALRMYRRSKLPWRRLVWTADADADRRTSQSVCLYTTRLRHSASSYQITSFTSSSSRQLTFPSATTSGVFRMCERRGPGSLGDGSPQKLTLFVTECLNFDVLEEKISKTAKNTTIKIMVGWKGGRRRPP